MVIHDQTLYSRAYISLHPAQLRKDAHSLLKEAQVNERSFSAELGEGKCMFCCTACGIQIRLLNRSLAVFFLVEYFTCQALNIDYPSQGDVYNKLYKWNIFHIYLFQKNFNFFSK